MATLRETVKQLQDGLNAADHLIKVWSTKASDLSKRNGRLLKIVRSLRNEMRAMSDALDDAREKLHDAKSSANYDLDLVRQTLSVCISDRDHWEDCAEKARRDRDRADAELERTSELLRAHVAHYYHTSVKVEDNDD